MILHGELSDELFLLLWFRSSINLSISISGKKKKKKKKQTQKKNCKTNKSIKTPSGLFTTSMKPYTAIKYARNIGCASFYDFGILIWNYSDSVVFFVFQFIKYDKTQ